MSKFKKIHKLLVGLAIVLITIVPLYAQTTSKTPIRVLQLSDLHLFQDQAAIMPGIGINTYDSLQHVMRLVDESVQQQTPSLMAITGDVSQDHSVASYQLTKQIFRHLTFPIIATMGNHDDYAMFTQALNDPKDSAQKIVYLGNWMILFVNSNWPPYHVPGKLDDNELVFLNTALTAGSDKHVIIFMHHHILPVHSAWIDKIGVTNAAEFLSIIDQHHNIKAVVCGHVHQESYRERNQVQYYSTPSTSWQFLSNSDGYQLGSLMPGFRWLDLYEDGTFTTGVMRIPYNPKFIPNLNNQGY